MIPLRLAVRNFMCYREPPALDLRPIRIACLCGDNGHGKSALLDAITWALWGRARGGSQDELIHRGRTEMSVELDFSARDRLYRVSRRRSTGRAGRGATVLELQVDSGGRMVPLTGNTVRETEAAIRELLHMDYETFVNTALLLQGRADMFTASAPAARKQVLAEVLDLGYYESLAVRARERARERDQGIAALDATLEAHAPEIAARPRYEAELAERGAELAGVEAELAAAREEVGRLGARAERLGASRAQLATIESRLGEARADAEALAETARAHGARIAELASLTARSGEIAAGLERLRRAREARDAMDRALETVRALEAERAEAEREAAVARERARAEASARREAVERLEAAAGRVGELEALGSSIVADRDRAADLAAAAERGRRDLARLRAERESLDARTEELVERMRETRSRFDLLAAGDAHCPVCRQALGAEGADHLRSEFEGRGREARRLHAENRERAAGLDGEIDRAQAAAERAAAEAEEASRRAERRAAQVERDLAAAREAAGRLGAEREALAALEERAGRVDPGGGLGDALAAVDARLGELGYDPAAHEDARREATGLEPYAELGAALARAEADLPRERAGRESALEMADRRGREIEADEGAAAELRALIADLPALEERLAAARGGAAGLDARRGELAADVGALRERVARCERLEARAAEARRRRDELADERSIYGDLARAFGRNGIQAMVIETAIPQITSSASDLLGRLSGGAMSVRLELGEGRRERGSGEPTERLDIRVADERGDVRSYELFSGGEAFRINLAVRIALSRMLAARSGAPLPVLFIDEGFGSQDAAGQDRLREVINSIQDEFQKILVITHIEAIKESFPVRIEVEKTPSGSTFAVT